MRQLADASAGLACPRSIARRLCVGQRPPASPAHPYHPTHPHVHFTSRTVNSALKLIEEQARALEAARSAVYLPLGPGVRGGPPPGLSPPSAYPHPSPAVQRERAPSGPPARAPQPPAPAAQSTHTQRLTSSPSPARSTPPPPPPSSSSSMMVRYAGWACGTCSLVHDAGEIEANETLRCLCCEMPAPHNVHTPHNLLASQSAPVGGGGGIPIAAPASSAPHGLTPWELGEYKQLGGPTISTNPAADEWEEAGGRGSRAARTQQQASTSTTAGSTVPSGGATNAGFGRVSGLVLTAVTGTMLKNGSNRESEHLSARGGTFTMVFYPNPPSPRAHSAHSHLHYSTLLCWRHEEKVQRSV